MEADTNISFDYQDFFSVLMYYGNMSKADIMNSSRPFLYGIYKMYGKRACENLGVSSENKEEKKKDATSDYPVEFKKLTRRERKEATQEFANSEDFLAQFAGLGANKYNTQTIFADKKER